MTVSEACPINVLMDLFLAGFINYDRDATKCGVTRQLKGPVLYKDFDHKMIGHE